MNQRTADRIRLGVSACLLGEPVRYDGGHKREPMIVDRLGPLVSWVPVCPELELGLGVPRERIQLQDDPRMPRLRGVDSVEDLTDQMRSYAAERISELQQIDLDGFVFKSASPSCGVEGVPVLDRGGEEIGRAAGLFAACILENWPELPVCNEVELKESSARRHFLEQAFTRHRWRRWVHRSAPLDREFSADSDLMSFLSAHDLLLICREQEPLARNDELSRAGSELLSRLRQPPTAEGHVRALVHAMDHVPGALPPHREAMAILIDDVRHGRIDPEVPRQLLRWLAEHWGEPYLRGQHYLDPFPKSLRERAASAA